MTVQTPSGERSMWFAGEHVEIDEPRLLVYSEAMADRYGATPQSPVTTVRVELADEAGSRRGLRLTHGRGSPLTRQATAGCRWRWTSSKPH